LERASCLLLLSNNACLLGRSFPPPSPSSFWRFLSWDDRRSCSPNEVLARSYPKLPCQPFDSSWLAVAPPVTRRTRSFPPPFFSPGASFFFLASLRPITASDWSSLFLPARLLFFCVDFAPFDDAQLPASPATRRSESCQFPSRCGRPESMTFLPFLT